MKDIITQLKDNKNVSTAEIVDKLVVDHLSLVYNEVHDMDTSSSTNDTVTNLVELLKLRYTIEKD